MALSRFDRARDLVDGDLLAPMRGVLSALGDPHLDCPRCIHIAGTNGKGSVAALARSVAESVGLSVHVFTSPHLVRPNERIRIAGRLIGDDELIASLDEIAATGVGVTYFEAFAAAAFMWFSRVRADLAVIETGAGGSHDATNVLDTDVSVITAIGRDHEAMFGVSGEAAIARVKAGIMRAGKPVVIARQSQTVRATLLECARQAGAEPFVCDVDWQCRDTGAGILFSAPGIRIGPAETGLAGHHQVDNAGAAVAALALVLGADGVSSGAAGLARVCWPGRLQALCSGPLTDMVRGQLIVDGAHNEQGMRALAVEIMRRGGCASVVVAIGINKPAGRMIGILAECVSGMVFCPLPDPAQETAQVGVPVSELARIASGCGVQSHCVADLPDAVARAAHMGDDVYICGSLYLIGEALRLNHQMPE